jgi:AAA domain
LIPPLPVVRVGEIPSQDTPRRWLVEQLWGASSVGVIGGAPKCSKTWLGLDLALSVATGTPCLGQYAVPDPGPVLVYLAEDALPIVRQRVEGIARHRRLALERVEIHVITAPTLRLDREQHRGQLRETAQRLRPRLLLLDPLVRLLHADRPPGTSPRIDRLRIGENACFGPSVGCGDRGDATGPIICAAFAFKKAIPENPGEAY